MTETSKLVWIREKEQTEKHGTLSGLLDFTQLLNSSYEPPKWIVSNFISEASGTMLCAKSGKGKTWIAMTVALVAAKGSTVGLWEAPRAHKVLYLDGEMHPGDMKERLDLVNQSVPGDLDPGNFIFFSSVVSGESDILESAFKAQVINTLNAGSFDLLVVDNLSSLMKSQNDENGSAWGDEWTNWMNDVTRGTGAAVFAIHHAGKAGDGGRGSSARVRNLRFDWAAGSYDTPRKVDKRADEEWEDEEQTSVIALRIRADKARSKVVKKQHFYLDTETKEVSVTREKRSEASGVVLHGEISKLWHNLPKGNSPELDRLLRLMEEKHGFTPPPSAKAPSQKIQQVKQKLQTLGYLS